MEHRQHEECLDRLRGELETLGQQLRESRAENLRLESEVKKKEEVSVLMLQVKEMRADRDWHRDQCEGFRIKMKDQNAEIVQLKEEVLDLKS